jgi:hypothetical protein
MQVSEDGRSIRLVDDAGCDVAIFHPPRLLALDGHDPQTYLEEQATPGRHILLLMQAGVSAIGLWQDDELIRHKVIRKYVVRGRGRAQPLHLKTRGKSRYGSRLRLQQAKQQLIETNTKLREFWEESAPPKTVFYSVPVRTFPELFHVEPNPPIEREDPRFKKIPFHVHRPDLAELQRSHRVLSRGRIEFTNPDS